MGIRAWHNKGPEPYGGTSAHASFEIAWSDAGAPEYTVGAHRMTLHPGCAIIVPARVEHTTQLGAGVRAKVLGLHASVVEEMADAMSLRAPREASITRVRPRLVALGELIFDEAIERTAGHDLAIEAMTEALAVEVIRVDPPSPACEKIPGDPRIRRAITFIDASYAGPLSLDAIAKVAGMSRFYFGRLFVAQVGKSPYRYLVDVRVARAASLIRGGRVSVTEAALSVGFNDLGRFGRAFRARFGVTPSEALAASRPRRRADRTSTARTA
jgi:AraC family transcriptional regulator